MVLDPTTVLAGGLIVLLIVVVAVLAARWKRRSKGRMTTEGVRDLAAWIDDGRRLFNDWKERVERLDELNRRLADMAEEIGQLRAQVARIDELRTEMLRLGDEAGRLRAERDELQEALARITEIAHRTVARTPHQPPP